MLIKGKNKKQTKKSLAPPTQVSYLLVFVYLFSYNKACFASSAEIPPISFTKSISLFESIFIFCYNEKSARIPVKYESLQMPLPPSLLFPTSSALCSVINHRTLPFYWIGQSSFSHFRSVHKAPHPQNTTSQSSNYSISLLLPGEHGT